MNQRRWLIGTAIVLAVVGGWQFWQSQRPMVTLTEGRHPIVIGARRIEVPSSVLESEPTAVIDLTKTFLIVHPPLDENKESPPTAPPTIELLPMPRPVLEETDEPPTATEIPASFRLHAAEPQAPHTAFPALGPNVRMLLERVASTFSIEPESAPNAWFEKFEKTIAKLIASPDRNPDLWQSPLAADVRRWRQSRAFAQPVHAGCTYFGGASGGLQGRFTPAAERQQPRKIESAEIHPGVSKRGLVDLPH